MFRRTLAVTICAMLLPATVLAFQVPGEGSQNKAETLWACAGSTWAQDPEMKDGSYYSTRTVNCKVKATLSISQIYDAMKNQVEGSKSMKITHGPELTSNSNGKVTKYLVTDQVDPDTDPLVIDEEITLQVDQKKHFSYQTDSKSIQGSGNASFLEKVTFGFQVREHKESGYYEVTLSNSIQVKRPWYAPAPIFKAVAKDKAISKFDTTTEEFLSRTFSTPVISQANMPIVLTVSKR